MAPWFECAKLLTHSRLGNIDIIWRYTISKDGFWRFFYPIREVFESNENESNSNYAFRLNEKIDGLINLLSNEFGRKMTIMSTSRGTNGSMESALRQNFREEREALHELATSLRTKKGDEAGAHHKFINAQHKTDIGYLDIVKSKWIYWRLEMIIIIIDCDYFRWNKLLNLYCQRCILASSLNYISKISILERMISLT